MTFTLQMLRRRRDAIRSAAARHGAGRVWAFGPVLSGEAPIGTGIDLLVDMGPGRSLLDLAALRRELEELLDHEVNLVTTGGLTERDTGVLEEAVAL